MTGIQKCTMTNAQDKNTSLNNSLKNETSVTSRNILQKTL